MLQFYLSMMNSGEDKALVEFLYNEYKQLMFKTAYAILRNRESAEDAVHDAFLRVINHLSKFRSYSCKENVSYLVIIVRGIALNMVSKSNRQAELDEETPDGMSVEDSVLSELAYEEIVENIKALSPALRDTTIVRIAVATSESVWRIPHFARIDVSPANSAEPNA